jgi:hypothetical protein
MDRGKHADEVCEDHPHHLAALSLCRAADALEQTASDPTTWFLIILDLNRALYCALIVALSGSAQIGAYRDDVQAKWMEWFEASRNDPNRGPPTENFVLQFKDLLLREKAERPTCGVHHCKSRQSNAVK